MGLDQLPSLKAGFEPVEPGEVLSILRNLRIETWHYRAQGPGVRHMGPMAEDFYSAFGLGPDDGYIATVDIDGVGLAAIQALAAENDALRAQVRVLAERLDALEAGPAQ